MSRLVLLILITLTAAGCALGPRYQRPDVAVPDTFRGATTAGASADSLADLQWSALFDDPALTALVTTALQQNFDLRIAAERVQQARARLPHPAQRSVPGDRRLRRRRHQRRVA